MDEVTSSGALGSWAQISPGPTTARAGTWRTTSAAPSQGRSCRATHERSSTGRRHCSGTPELCREIMEQRKARSWQRALDPMADRLVCASRRVQVELWDRSAPRLQSRACSPRQAAATAARTGRAARSAGSARRARGGRKRGEVPGIGGSGGRAGGRGQARGASALAVHAAQIAQAAHATRGRGAPVAPGTQRGKHARAQAQARDKREEEKRNKARGKALAASSWV